LPRGASGTSEEARKRSSEVPQRLKPSLKLRHSKSEFFHSL
jgi:hypothetical protein